MGYNDLVQRGHLVPLELLAEVSRRAVCGASIGKIVEILAWNALARPALGPLRIPDLGPRVSFSKERELHLRASGAARSRSGLKVDGVELRHAQDGQRRRQGTGNRLSASAAGERMRAPYHVSFFRYRNSWPDDSYCNPQRSWYCQQFSGTMIPFKILISP